jgi:hypothetical protein
MTLAGMMKAVTMIMDFFGRRQLTQHEPNITGTEGKKKLDMVSYAESPNLYVFEQLRK